MIQELVSEPLPAGSSILVEFDPASLWYEAAVAIAAGWLRTGGGVAYSGFTQPPEKICYRLKRLGFELDKLENEKSAEGLEKLRIWDWYSDNVSALDRFNEERDWIVELTRAFPAVSLRKFTVLLGIMKGIHSERAYKQLEGAADGVIDIKVEEVGKATASFMRIRSMRDIRFDS